LVAIQCLKANNYVGPDYTVDDFDNRTFPFNPYADGPNDCLYGAGYAYFDN